MCCGSRVVGSAEERALRVGIVIAACAGLTSAVVFNAAGVAPHIYLPDGWTGPIRDAAIVKQMEVLALRVFDEIDVTEVWRRIANAAQESTPQRFYGMLTVPGWESHAAD